MPDASMIEPADPQQEQQQESQVEPQQGEAQGPKLTPQLLKMPAMQALFAGAPPALSAHVKDFTVKTRDEARVIKENLPALQQAGMGFYQSLSKQLGVIYNKLHIHEADLLAADKAGKLQQLAPPFDQINHAVGKSGMRNPVLAVSHVPKGFKMPAQIAAPQLSPQMAPGTAGQPISPENPPQGAAPLPASGGAQGAPSGVQRALAKARISALQPGAPTSGPSPGAGRLLNSILKPVV